MVYVRGHARDYDAWAGMGAKGWSYADVLPYFKRMETWDSAGHGGDPDWRGTDGPLRVRRGKRKNPLDHAFVAAGKQAGYPVTSDYNGEQQEGFGAFEHTIHRGRRWSAANAYLHPAMRRWRCQVIYGLAEKVLIEDRRTVGVRVRRGDQATDVHARREVIIAASPINSPKLLMLSGIGPAAHLSEHGIEMVADRPGVGQNLQDHLEVYFQCASKKPITLFKYWNLPGKALLGAEWLLGRQGLASSNNFESCAFIRSAEGVEYPDIQMHFLPFAVRYDGKAAAEGHGYQIHVGPMRSPSRGAVTLQSADPNDAPSILFNYMSTEQDWVDFRRALRFTREVFQQEAFEPFLRHEILPGSGATSDDDLDAFVREHGESAYHPCGTCRMGSADDPQAVVDPECRVIGVEGLRVADSSIFPQITNGNLNGPSIMVGEKASDHILGRSLAPDPSEPWINPDWQTSQR